MSFSVSGAVDLRRGLIELLVDPPDYGKIGVLFIKEVICKVIRRNTLIHLVSKLNLKPRLYAQFAPWCKFTTGCKIAPGSKFAPPYVAFICQ